MGPKIDTGDLDQFNSIFAVEGSKKQILKYINCW